MAAAASAATTSKSRTKELLRNSCHASCGCNSETSSDIHCGASIYAIALNCEESTLVLGLHSGDASTDFWVEVEVHCHNAPKHKLEAGMRGRGALKIAPACCLLVSYDH